MTYDVAIVGAGIVGAACAFACSQAGLKVTAIEQQFAGSGATAAGMGHIVVMDDSEAQFALTRYSSDLWAQLAPDMPRAAEYTACGTLWVAADESEMCEVRRKHRFYAERGVATEVLDEAQLPEAEPQLRRGLAGALLVPGDSVLYPPCAAQRLLDLAGVTVQRGCAGSISDDGVRMTDSSFVSAGISINAAGVYAPRLTPEIPIRIQPRKGHLFITDRYPGFLRHQLVELGYLKSAHTLTSDSVAFNVQPRLSGQLLIGSSRQFGADDAAMDGEIASRMLARAVEYLPALARLSVIRGWTGLRAATPDKLPLIGLCPGYRNVYLAAGHEGLGITTSLATGRLLADQILGKAPAIPAGPYLPGRVPAAHA